MHEKMTQMTFEEKGMDFKGKSEERKREMACLGKSMIKELTGDDVDQVAKAAERPRCVLDQSTSTSEGAGDGVDVAQTEENRARSGEMHRKEGLEQEL